MASYSNMKVRAGQVWVKPSSSLRIFITRVEGNTAFFKLGTTDAPSVLEQATFLISNGTPKDWDEGWVIEKEVTPATLLDFFKGVPEGHCPCNILRKQCNYHR